MRYPFGLKLILFVSALSIGAYILAINHSIFDNLPELSQDNNATQAQIVTTPTPPNESTNFRPDGGFDFSSKPPKAFEDIHWLAVVTGSSVGYGSACAPSPCAPPPIENRVSWISQTPHGFFVTDNHLYDWRDENLSVDRVSFSTETYKGRSYAFTGRFLVDGTFEKSKPEGAVLSGHLVKLVNGCTVAEEDVIFSWFNRDEIDPQAFRRVKKSSRK